MAKKFGGQFSPDAPGQSGPQGPSSLDHARPKRRNVAARLLFIPPIPLFVAGILAVMGGNPIEMTLELGGAALLLLGAWLLDEGLKAEAAYHERAIARPPAIPRKILAALACAGGVIAAQWSGGAGLFAALGTGAVALALHLVAFGLDPMKRKGTAGMSEFDSERIARAVDKAEATLAELVAAGRSLPERALTDRIEAIAASAREMFRTVENDPRDLSRARKFMTVYLTGARDATVKFADLWARNRDPSAKADYEALLSDLESSFAARKEELLLDNRTDLDVEIEVLRDRLNREGLKPL